MTEAELSDSLRRFVRQCIHSVRLVEVLLLLVGEPERNWTPGDVSAQLRCSTSAAAEQLEELAHRGLLLRSRQTGQYGYQPRTQELADCVDELADAYARRRQRLIAFIYGEPDAADVISKGFTFRRRP